MKLTIIYIFLGLVVLCLSIYLGSLYSKLLQQRAKEKEGKRILLEKLKDIKQSIVMISKATIQGQCEISECILRNYHLLKRINLLDAYPLFDELYTLIKDFDTLEARNKLSAREAHKQDKLRFKIEDENKAIVVEECERLVTDLS